jgi:hypothetical protein
MVSKVMRVCMLNAWHTDEHYLTLWLLMYTGCVAHASTFFVNFSDF